LHTTDIAAGRRTSGAAPGIKKHFKRKSRNHDTDNRQGGVCSFDELDFKVFVFFIKMNVNAKLSSYCKGLQWAPEFKPGPFSKKLP